MTTFFWATVIIISVIVVIRDFTRDIIIELQIRKGVDPKDARKDFSIKKLVKGEYANLFKKTNLETDIVTEDTSMGDMIHEENNDLPELS